MMDDYGLRPGWKIQLVTWGIILGISALAIVGDALYAKAMYGDWHCGMPGVECRKVVP